MAPPALVASDRKQMIGADYIDLYSVCTSHEERNNLTIRTFMRRFTRLSLGFSKKLENLAAAVAMHVAHYNFCRIHGSLRTTPAMAAEVVDELWTIEDLYDAVVAWPSARHKPPAWGGFSCAGGRMPGGRKPSRINRSEDGYTRPPAANVPDLRW